MDTNQRTWSTLVDEVNQQVADAYARLGWRHPVGAVQWVHIDRVRANNWNPNAVAPHEMRLLHTSITADGYTQPCVCIRDGDQYVIVDGFHRYTVMRTQRDIYDTTGGYLPVVIIDAGQADLMASTVRHNRARGKHSVDGMSHLVFSMLQDGMPDTEICAKLGLEAEELARLKFITGFAKLYADHEYSEAILTRRQIDEKRRWTREHPDDPAPQHM